MRIRSTPTDCGHDTNAQQKQIDAIEHNTDKQNIWNANVDPSCIDNNAGKCTLYALCDSMIVCENDHVLCWVV